MRANRESIKAESNAIHARTRARRDARLRKEEETWRKEQCEKKAAKPDHVDQEAEEELKVADENKKTTMKQEQKRKKIAADLTAEYFGLEAGAGKQHEQLGGIGSGANKVTSSARFCGVPVRSIHFDNASEPADSIIYLNYVRWL